MKLRDVVETGQSVMFRSRIDQIIDTDRLKMLEKQMGRVLMAHKRGKKPKEGLSEVLPE